jgi:hypothetical protein
MDLGAREQGVRKSVWLQGGMKYVNGKWREVACVSVGDEELNDLCP